MVRSTNIIAATNFSEIADNAVSYAAGLAKASGAKLVLFNCFSLNVNASVSKAASESMLEQIDENSQRLRKLAKGLSELYDIEVFTHSSPSFVEESLHQLISKTSAELVVMGLEEKSLEQDIIGGSISSEIKKLQIPVLAVPLKARFNKVNKILYACDNLSLSAIKKISWLRKAVGKLATEIEVFSVEEMLSDFKKEQSETLIQFIAANEMEKVRYIYKNIRSNTVIDEISNEVEFYDADILVMVPQKYGFWDSMVHRSKTRMMAAALNKPILSYPAFY